MGASVVSLPRNDIATQARMGEGGGDLGDYFIASCGEREEVKGLKLLRVISPPSG